MRASSVPWCAVVLGVAGWAVAETNSCLKTRNGPKCSSFWMVETRWCKNGAVTTACNEWVVDLDEITTTVSAAIFPETGHIGSTSNASHCTVHKRHCEVVEDETGSHQTGRCVEDGDQGFTCLGEMEDPITASCEGMH
jgi:hypothetical protein